MQKNVPIVRNSVQGGPRHVVRYRVVIDYRDIRERVVVKKRKGGHVEKLQARSAENSDAARGLIRKPEENLDSCTEKPLMYTLQLGRNWRTGRKDKPVVFVLQSAGTDITQDITSSGFPVVRLTLKEQPLTEIAKVAVISFDVITDLVTKC